MNINPVPWLTRSPTGVAVCKDMYPKIENTAIAEIFSNRELAKAIIIVLEIISVSSLRYPAKVIVPLKPMFKEKMIWPNAIIHMLGSDKRDQLGLYNSARPMEAPGSVTENMIIKT